MRLMFAVGSDGSLARVTVWEAYCYVRCSGEQSKNESKQFQHDLLVYDW